MKNCIAIIPARGGSKRIPKKNIRNFLGKPVIQYSIDAAKKSKIFDEVMVSTDDVKIAKISISSGAIVPFYRSKRNSDDRATMADVIKEVLRFYSKKGVNFQYFACIYAVAPFININILKKSYEMLINHKVDAVIPVIAYSHPIQRALEINKNGKLIMINKKYRKVRTQDLPKRYHDSAQFFFMRTESFLKKKQIFTDNTMAIEVQQQYAQDIDNENDWRNAEIKYQVIKKYRKHEQI